MSQAEVLRNFSYVGMGRAFGDLATFLLLLVLARVFGPQGAGVYGMAMSLTGLFAVVADFGLQAFAVTELNRQKAPPDLLSRILSLRLVLSTAASLALLLIVGALRLEPGIAIVVIAIGLYQLTQRVADGIGAALMARGLPGIAGALEIAAKIVATGAGTVIALLGGSLAAAVAPLPIAALAQTILALWVAERKIGEVGPHIDATTLRATARDSQAYAVSSLMLYMGGRLDVALVGLFLGSGAAGLYHAAHRLTVVMLWLPQFAATAVLPLATRTWAKGPAKTATLYRRALGDLALVGVPAAAVFAWTASELVVLLFGAGFARAADVLRVLALLVPLACVSRIAGTFLLAGARAGSMARWQSLATLLKLCASAALIPWFGLEGAAFASVLTELALLLLFARGVAPDAGWPHAEPRLWLAAAGTALSVAALWALPPLPLSVALAAAAFLYVGFIVLASPDIRKHEVQTVLRWARLR